MPADKKLPQSHKYTKNGSVTKAHQFPPNISSDNAFTTFLPRFDTAQKKAN